MSDSRAILAIDLGTSGAKVSIVTLDGDCIDWTLEEVDLILQGTDSAEQDPDEWWRAIDTAAIRVIERNPDARSRIAAVCTSAMGEETVPVDRDGNALMNAIIWMDHRGAAAIQERLSGRINPFGLGFGIGNLAKWVRYTGGVPSPSGKDPAGHISYIRAELPEVYDKTYKFLNSLDFVNLRLTGEFVATYDSVLPLWVTDNRNLSDIRYHPRLLDTLGFDREKLPDLVPATEVIGQLLPTVSEAWGLSNSVKVVAGSTDTTAAAVGGGAIEDYDPCLTLGTSAYITAHVPYKKTDVSNNMASFPSAVPGKYLLMNNQTVAGGNLSFIADRIVYHKDELLQEEKKPDLYKVFDKVVQKVPPGSNGLLYTPWLYGERSPIEDLFVRGGIHNISLLNNREDIIRAVFEGVTFNARWLYDGVRKFLKETPDALRMTGGGAASDIWCQMFSDVFDCTILQMADPIRTNARGAAFIGAVGIDALTFDDVPDRVPIKAAYEPNSKNRELYDDRYELFRQFYRKTKGIYKKLNRDRPK